jgi:protoporphyrinogen oxidase
MARKIAGAVPGLKKKGAGRFFYPRGGYGAISQAYYEAAQAAGADFLMNATVCAVEHEEGRAVAVTVSQGDRRLRLPVDHVWSTIPVSALIEALQPGAPHAVVEAARRIEFRAMLLVYLVLEQERFTEYDAHYFPEPQIKISRLSEPKNYGLAGPTATTVLCAELPCSPDDPEWTLTADELGELVRDSLHRAGIPLAGPPREVVVRRLRQVYPVYRVGYERHLTVIDEYLDRFGNLVSFGRQGLFVHDNTHHTLFMGYAASTCLGEDGVFDRARWHDYRQVFSTHVVED